MFLNMHAQDFLNAFEILKESDEALIDRQSGGSFNLSAVKAFGRRPAMSVAIVCLAFSVELNRTSEDLPVRRLRKITCTNALRFPGVRCCISSTTQTSPL